MLLWRRILSYLGAHRGVLVLAALASALYAAVDAFSIVVLIPFLATVFGVGGDAAGDTEAAAGIDRMIPARAPATAEDR